MFNKKTVKKSANNADESELNAISQKHLDFYNEEVRDLEQNSETPDEANEMLESSKSQQKRKIVWRILKKKKT